MSLIFFLSSLISSFILSFLVYKISLRYRLLDYITESRKVHERPVPNTGGIAIFIGFWVIMAIFIIANHTSGFYLKYLIGLFIASLLLFIIGNIDDRRPLSPNIKLISQIASALIIIASGIGITYLNNPMGGLIFFDQIKIPTELFGAIYNITLWADIFALLWIVGVINIINFLDGLDGLASGVGAISFFVIYILSTSPLVDQPLSGLIALIALGAVLGFLPFNLNPAKMFMGDSGSTFLGLLLAVLAIIAGGKLATALLVLGLPIFDGLWVVGSRLLKGKRPWEAGRDHLHHKLIDLGISKRWIVIIFWAITALFGGISMLGGTQEKSLALIILLAILLLGMIIINNSCRKSSLNKT